MKIPDETTSFAALARRLEELAGRLLVVASREPDDCATVRHDLEALQSEAEGLGRPDLAGVLGRLALLTDVEECLAAEGPVRGLRVALAALAILVTLVGLYWLLRPHH